MPLDPQAQSLLEQLAMLEEFYEFSLEEIRRRGDASSAVSDNPEPVAQVEDLAFAGPGGPLYVRIYTPAGHGPFPMLVYLHGGGWIIGNLDMADPICRNITNTAHCIVIAVAYRLAPENKFPAAIDDTFATLQWAARNASKFHGDPTRLAIGGDSAGGNLAAAATLIARDQGEPHLSYQVLLYPSTDLSVTLPSTENKVEYTLLTTERANFHSACYLNGWEDALNPKASPLLATSLAHLPPALVVTTGYDLLHEQGRRYAEQLQAADVPVTYRHYPDMMHGFISMADFLDRGKEALTDIGKTLYHVFYDTDPHKILHQPPSTIRSGY
jgi:Esterase/lipase